MSIYSRLTFFLERRTSGECFILLILRCRNISDMVHGTKLRGTLYSIELVFGFFCDSFFSLLVSLLLSSLLVGVGVGWGWGLYCLGVDGISGLARPHAYLESHVVNQAKVDRICLLRTPKYTVDVKHLSLI